MGVLVMKGPAMVLSMIALFMAVVVVAELQRFQQPVKADGSLSILVVGDWGRRGTYNQSQVAFQEIITNCNFPPSISFIFDRAELLNLTNKFLFSFVSRMGRIGEKLDADFIISTGDNFYDDGLIDENDPAFEESFTNIYIAPSLQKQWFSVLGNHDYRGDALAQMSPTLIKKDSKWLCLKSFIVNAGTVEIFFVDTTPFQDKYFSDEENKYDWRGVLPREDYLSNVLKEVDLALRESSAKWKIVVGHHAIRSIGHHGDTQELVAQLLPILQENNVDLYMNGHDHCLQHISSRDSDIQFLTSGAGSKAWRGDLNWINPDELKFYYDGQGFMALQITQNDIHVNFYDGFGNVLHKWNRSKSPFSEM